MCKTIECPECGAGVKVSADTTLMRDALEQLTQAVARLEANSKRTVAGSEKITVYLDGAPIHRTSATRGNLTSNVLPRLETKVAPQVTCLGNCDSADCANHLSGRCVK